MKSFLLIFLLLYPLYAEHIRWHSDYEKAHQKALKENKLLMVLLVEKECSLCYKLLKNTFQNQPYIQELNKQFISVIVMKGQKQSYPIELLYTMIYPSVFFLNEKELFVGENIFGYIDSKAFKEHLNLL